MPPTIFLTTLRERDIDIWVEGNELVLWDANGEIAERITGYCRRHKVALLTLLAKPATSPSFEMPRVTIVPRGLRLARFSNDVTPAPTPLPFRATCLRHDLPPRPSGEGWDDYDEMAHVERVYWLERLGTTTLFPWRWLIEAAEEESLPVATILVGAEPPLTVTDWVFAAAVEVKGIISGSENRTRTAQEAERLNVLLSILNTVDLWWRQSVTPGIPTAEDDELVVQELPDEIGVGGAS